MQLIKWTERSFSFGYPENYFPLFLERLKGIAVRIEELVKDVPDNILSRKKDGRWSVKEHVGHLIDLEELGEGRIHDFGDGLSVLRAADMTNRKTYEAGHNSKPVNELTALFRQHRQTFIDHLEQTDEATRRHRALHPRLQQLITLTDLLYFIAEHDNQHLTIVSMMLEERGIRK